VWKSLWIRASAKYLAKATFDLLGVVLVCGMCCVLCLCVECVVCCACVWNVLCVVCVMMPCAARSAPLCFSCSEYRQHSDLRLFGVPLNQSNQRASLHRDVTDL